MFSLKLKEMKHVFQTRAQQTPEPNGDVTSNGADKLSLDGFLYQGRGGRQV